MSQEKMIEIIDTKITDKWGVNWDEMETVRDFLQNFYDANDIKEIKINIKGKTVTVSAPSIFDYQELLYLGTDKDDNPDLIGQYGEGWKASVLNALRNYNCTVEIIIEDKRLEFYFEDKKIGKSYKRVIFCKVSKTKSINGSKLIIGNCTPNIVQEFQFGFRYFYYENNPLFGELLNSTWDKPIEFYASTDGKGYVFYKNLLRSRIDAPIVIVCNKSYHHVDVKIKHDRDRKAFNDEVLLSLYKYVCKKASNYENIVNHLKEFWVNGHKLLSTLSSSRRWTRGKMEFPEKYYAKNSEERYNKIDKKDFDLIVEVEKVNEEFKEKGYIQCSSYMYYFGMKSPRSVAEERLKSKLEKNLSSNSRDTSFNEQTAVNLLVEVVKYFSKDLYTKCNSYKYTIAESDETVQNLITNRKYNEGRIFLNKSFFTYEFADAFILLIREWEKVLQENSIFSNFYISLITSFLKKKESSTLFKKFEVNWDDLVSKIIEGDEFIPIGIDSHINRQKKIKRIRNLFVEGEMDRVLEEVNKFVIIKEELRDEITLITEQYKTWQKGYNQGLENADSTVINKVKRSILKLINQLDKEGTI